MFLGCNLSDIKTSTMSFNEDLYHMYCEDQIKLVEKMDRVKGMVRSVYDELQLLKLERDNLKSTSTCVQNDDKLSEVEKQYEKKLKRQTKLLNIKSEIYDQIEFVKERLEELNETRA